MKSTYLASEVLKRALTGADALPTHPNIYLSLHSSDPGASGSQETDEVSYTGYTRVKLDPSAWSVEGNVATYTKGVQFPICLGGDAKVVCICIGTQAEGAGNVLYRARLGAAITYTRNKVPVVAPYDIKIVEA